MININQLGLIVDERVTVRVFHQIEKGPMRAIKGIIIHQTDSSSAEGSFNSYRNGAAGAHLLIDKDGTIYQTASLQQQTWHVGKLRSRCLAELSCSPSEMPIAKRFNPTVTHRRELQKTVPSRYPSNEDAIGIEIVGQALPLNEPNPDKRVYEALTVAQKDSLAWLIRGLTIKLGISMQEIFRHPTVSYKNATEAAGATW